jgi:mannose-6-phosphate isomerase-like protein (cupin superfamily)
MSNFFLDTGKIPADKKDWGSIKSLFDGAEVGAAGGFTMGYIVYDKPHYSGVHEDNEVIYILAGKGSARIGEQDIDFQENYLLTIPAGTEHSITRVTGGPVKAILVHFM